MKNVPIKLNQQVEEFHYFEDNQVLTASHLNTVVDFFDRRDRMTRTRLIGTGIVCGLEIDFNNSNKTITISKGTAVTSDGDVLHMDENTVFSHVKIFEDKKAQYDLFKNGSQPIPLFQLFKVGSKEENIHSLRGVNNPIKNMGDMVVVFYLNSFLQEPEDCTEVDCENHGMRQVAKLIPLLIAKSDLDKISSKNKSPYFDLPEVDIHRVNFHLDTITHEENLLNRFKNAVELSSSSLIEALLASCSGKFISDLISPLYPNPSATWKTKLSSIFGQINIQDRPDVLYIYNFMKDLSEAYREFQESVFDLWVECTPNPSWHPKHVMVREILMENENLPAFFRHHFCESPILNHRGRQVQKARHLHQRINSMVEHFEVPNNKNLNIKITPSKNGDYHLGEKSLPYYYNNRNFSLNRFWNFDKTIRNKSNTILGYRASQYEGSNAAQNPLDFCHEKNNFYRIEGHLGKSRTEVEKQLEDLKKENNLNFNVVAVQIQDDKRTIRLPRLRFPGIDALFHHYREEFSSNIKTVDNFNLDLQSTTASEVADKNTPEGVMKKNLDRSKEEIISMKDEMQAAKSQVRTKIASFDQNYKVFKTNYQRAAVRGDLIHKNVYEYTQTKYETPMQNFVLNYKFNRFDGLIKYFRKKKEKVQEQYIFDKFFEQNPGLESLCGVPVGGTFVIVYTTATNEANERVVADFCLPSCCVIEVDPEIDPVEIQEEEIDKPDIQEKLPPIKFIEKIDLFKYSPIKSIVNHKVDFTVKDFDLKLGQFKELKLPETGGLTIATEMAVKDPAVASMMLNVENTTKEISILEEKAARTKEEDARLGFLYGHVDKTSETMIEMVMAKEGDIDVAGDDAKIIEFIGKATEGIQKKENLKKLDKKSKEMADKNATNPIKKGLGVRLRKRMGK